MDRFIVSVSTDYILGLTNLKSNMDRFIVFLKGHCAFFKLKFKIQYG